MADWPKPSFSSPIPSPAGKSDPKLPRADKAGIPWLPPRWPSCQDRTGSPPRPYGGWGGGQRGAGLYKWGVVLPEDVQQICEPLVLWNAKPGHRVLEKWPNGGKEQLGSRWNNWRWRGKTAWAGEAEAVVGSERKLLEYTWEKGDEAKEKPKEEGPALLGKWGCFRCTEYEMAKLGWSPELRREVKKWKC